MRQLGDANREGRDRDDHRDRDPAEGGVHGAPGSRITEVRVSTVMILLVLCPPRAIMTSKEPTIASRAS